MFSFYLLPLDEQMCKEEEEETLKSWNTPGLREPPQLWVIPPEKHLKGGEEHWDYTASFRGRAGK